MSEVSSDTRFFDVDKDSHDRVKLILADPVNQIVGYIMSGDPTYITSHNNARSTIMKAERDELVEEMLLAFIEANGWN